jgi:hypothetical protein
MALLLYLKALLIPLLLEQVELVDQVKLLVLMAMILYLVLLAYWVVEVVAVLLLVL